jgi:hypothetical protein
LRLSVLPQVVYRSLLHMANQGELQFRSERKVVHRIR